MCLKNKENIILTHILELVKTAGSISEVLEEKNGLTRHMNKLIKSKFKIKLEFTFQNMSINFQMSKENKATRLQLHNFKGYVDLARIKSYKAIETPSNLLR
jgi:hypothetical protein